MECLDPDRLRAIARDVAAPGERPGGNPVAVTASDRALIGVPASGPLPAGSALVLTGRMYQLLDFDQHEARVLLMFTMAVSWAGSRATGSLSRGAAARSTAA